MVLPIFLLGSHRKNGHQTTEFPTGGASSAPRRAICRKCRAATMFSLTRAVASKNAAFYPMNLGPLGPLGPLPTFFGVFDDIWRVYGKIDYLFLGESSK